MSLLQVNLTEDEKRELKVAAAQDGISVSEIIRSLVGAFLDSRD